MIYTYAHNLWRYPEAATKMFSDRSKQFRYRLKWSVHVDEGGYETDEYDALNPIYVIIDSPSNRHLGSMRLMPTTGPTMTSDIFLKAMEKEPIVGAGAWESSRFCVAPEAVESTSQELLIMSAIILKKIGARDLIATFDTRMIRVYKRLNIGPKILGSMESPQGKIFAGKWNLSDPKISSACNRIAQGSLPVELRPQYPICKENLQFKRSTDPKPLLSFMHHE